LAALAYEMQTVFREEIPFCNQRALCITARLVDLIICPLWSKQYGFASRNNNN